MNPKMLSYLLFMLGLLSACKENVDLTAYDQENTYIYFNDFEDVGGSLNYITERSVSFAFFPIEVNTIRVGIPLAIIGNPLSGDKAYRISIDEAETNLPKANYSIEEPVFHKGNIADSLFVVLRKSPEMTHKAFSLKLKLEANEHFQLGLSNSLSMKLNVSNRLEQPTWWHLYTDYFGPYYSEIYQQWILTYHRYADPTPNVETGERFFWYWNNMPTYVNDLPNYMPVLYHHIQLVKKYFREHEVYPNGDKSQPRILLP